jgi:hypothetical protein
VTRMSTSPARFTRSAVPTAHVSDARGRPLLPGSVDEEITGFLPANQVHAADQSSELPYSTTAQNADGRVDEGNLGGTIPPPATDGRDLSAEGGIGAATTAHDAERRVAFTSTAVQRSSGEEEAELRARISMDSLQLNALTMSETRRCGTSVDRSRPSTSTTPILTGATPTQANTLYPCTGSP